MPRGDKTGPEGKGALTGRGLGGCSPEDEKDIKKKTDWRAALGRKLGRGRGRGIGPKTGIRPQDGRGRP